MHARSYSERNACMHEPIVNTLHACTGEPVYHCNVSTISGVVLTLLHCRVYERACIHTVSVCTATVKVRDLHCTCTVIAVHLRVYIHACATAHILVLSCMRTVQRLHLHCVVILKTVSLYTFIIYIHC
jgi:hypothetical protein